MTSLSRRTVLAAAFGAVLGFVAQQSAATAGDMRIAFGDLPGIESIQTLAAIECSDRAPSPCHHFSRRALIA